jgi:hypothetical protein
MIEGKLEILKESLYEVRSESKVEDLGKTVCLKNKSNLVSLDDNYFKSKTN